MREGFSALGDDIANPGMGGGGGGGTTLAPVRVSEIVLSDTHPRFEEVGGWNGIGTIFYVSVDAPVFGNQTSGNKAKPSQSNIKQFPLINEIVFIFPLPDPDSQLGGSGGNNYYLNTVNVWNSQHHNALPNGLTLEENQKADYTSSLAGNVRRIKDTGSEIDLGSTFVERANINPLLPFEGDIMYEGRWGNSIRFGSTVSGSVNDWSEIGANGDPITIFRNGEDPNNNPEGWVPVVEDINNDLSSIWMTSTQQIPIEVASSNYNSYATAPEIPNQYTGTQIITNSDRILLNSKTDHIMLSSATSINMNAVDSVNIDTEEHIVDASSILLGNKDATEALMLGNKTIDLMGKMLDEMIAVNTQLSALMSLPPGAPFAPLNAQAIKSQTLLGSYKGQLNSLLSKQNKTI